MVTYCERQPKLVHGTLDYWTFPVYVLYFLKTFVPVCVISKSSMCKETAQLGILSYVHTHLSGQN